MEAPLHAFRYMYDLHEKHACVILETLRQSSKLESLCLDNKESAVLKFPIRTSIGLSTYFNILYALLFMHFLQAKDTGIVEPGCHFAAIREQGRLILTDSHTCMYMYVPLRYLHATCIINNNTCSTAVYTVHPCLNN